MIWPRFAATIPAYEPFYYDTAFNNPGDGLGYQDRILAAQTFIRPTIEDELFAHSLGVSLTKAGQP